MIKSEKIGEISKALAVFHGLVKPIKRDKLVNYTLKTGGTKKYSYAELSNLIDACREGLTKAELAVIQTSATKGAVVTITTILAHASDQFFQNDLELSAGGTDVQSIGSAITYGRRYEYASILGIAAEDDDDGATASENEKGKTAPATGAGQKPTAKAQGVAPKTGAQTPATGKAPEAKTPPPADSKPADPKTPPAEGEEKHRTPDDFRKEIAKMCLDMANQDSSDAIKILEEATRWTTKDDKGNEKILAGKRATADITDKAVPVVWRKIEAAHKKFFAAPEDQKAAS